MKRILTFLFCSWALFGVAQNIDISEYSQNLALKDTVIVPLHDADQIEPANGMIAETYQIPGYDLYNQYWDVNNLRSVLLTIPFSNDRIMLLLVQSSNNPFQLPCVFDELYLKYGLTKTGIFHPGVDLKVSSQTLIKSCFDGVVRMAKYYGQYGKMVVVRHYNGLETVYAHLDKISVKPGQFVNAGDVIGQAGKTGNTGSDLLHFETRFMNEYFDPELLIDFENEDLYKNTLVLMSKDFRILPLEDVGNISAISQTKPQTVSQFKSSSPSVPQTKPQQTAQNFSRQKDAIVKPPVSDTTHSSAVIQTGSSNSPEYHIVTSGETLYRISVNYHISVEKLMQFNHIQNGDVIKAGQKLRVK